MRGAIGGDGRQHIRSAIGHKTQDWYAQKKLGPSR